jgi:hypothetical protein
MPARLSRHAPELILSMAFLLAATSRLPAVAGQQAGLQAVMQGPTVSILDGQRPVLRYRYADVPFKPYADQLFSPAGVQVLRDSPFDHKHHHALMYALAVDGVDFWAEFNAQYGRQLQKTLSVSGSTCQGGVERAGLVEQLDWLGPASPKPLLVERRAIEVLKAADFGATLVQWCCRLETPPGKESMAIGGSHYFGLGVRFLVSMDRGGHFFNADDKAGSIVHGDEKLTPTRWYAYSAKADGKPVTVAVFDWPANLRHPATMFTMNTPFAYISATLNEWKQPLTVRAGHPLNLCYGVALWDGEVDKATVEKLYQRWVELSGQQKKN